MKPFRSGLLLLLSFALCAVPVAVGAMPRQIVASQSEDVRRLMQLAGDTVGKLLRSEGREHLYAEMSIDCPSCTPETQEAARAAFSSAAVATLVDRDARWPTLCDNSERLRLSAPAFTGDSAFVTIVSSHATRGSNHILGTQHALGFSRPLGNWVLARYERSLVELPAATSSQPEWCDWSPESPTGAGRAGAPANSASVPVSAVAAAESCPACVLSAIQVVSVGESGGGSALPGSGSSLFSDGKGRYFTQSPDLSRLLVFDSSGALHAVIGEASAGPRFSRIRKVAFNQSDSVYVLDAGDSRVYVLAPDLSVAREIRLPQPMDDLWVLRDGRLLGLRSNRAAGPPILVLSADGRLIRQFGPVPPAATNCANCAGLLVAPASSGYRLWIAGVEAGRVEEWDLTGRHVRTLALSGNMPSAARGRITAPSRGGARVNQRGRLVAIHSTQDGLLWIESESADNREARTLELIDAATARLVRVLQDVDPGMFVSEDLRATPREQLFGYVTFDVRRVQLVRRGTTSPRPSRF